MILKMVTELGSEVKLTPPDGVQSFHVQHLAHPHSGISDRFIIHNCQTQSNMITQSHLQLTTITKISLFSMGVEHAICAVVLVCAFKTRRHRHFSFLFFFRWFSAVIEGLDAEPPSVKCWAFFFWICLNFCRWASF